MTSKTPRLEWPVTGFVMGVHGCDDALEQVLEDEDEVVRHQAFVKMGRRAMVLPDAEASITVS